MAGIPAGLDLQQIRDQLNKLDEADVQIARAERAGIDMAERKKQAQEARQRLLKIKQAYFPGQ